MAAPLLRSCCGRLLYTRYRGHRLLGVRYLLPDSYLKYNEFSKEKTATAIYSSKDKDVFFKTIQAKLQNSENILEKDLKSMIYLCETETEIQLVKECLLRYHEVSETEYKFGPLFLRLCHSLGLPDTAFEMLKEKSSRKVMSNYTSWTILLDILYTHGQYERAMEVLLEMKDEGYKFNKLMYILACAICYKVNNLESWKTCVSFYDEAEMKQTPLPRLALCFTVALALKQEEYAKAMQVYDTIVKKDTSLCRSLDLLLAAKFNNEKKMLQIMETASNHPKFDFLRKVKFSKEVIYAAEMKLKPTDSCKKFYNLYEKLKHSGQISTLTLDEMLHAFQEYDLQTT